MWTRVASFLSLFGSVGTLVCCALPATFVALGAGATFASLVTTFPELIWLSEHKIAIFILAGVMLGFGGFLQWNARYQACPTDPRLAAECQNARGTSTLVYWISLIIYVIGGLFAFVLPWFYKN